MERRIRIPASGRGLPCSAPGVARECLAVMDGLQIQWALDPGSLDMPARVRDHFRRQYAAIRATGE
ncbi:hypothetical protein [Streptomyces griseus]|uniref:hypothetical protein n=1 Tax=Streptomyces griseus TaxID=1911 RepID=UPI00068A01B5|nr:hypothetical protein [Streptomyces griseus]